MVTWAGMEPGSNLWRSAPTWCSAEGTGRNKPLSRCDGSSSNRVWWRSRTTADRLGTVVPCTVPSAYTPEDTRDAGDTAVSRSAPGARRARATASTSRETSSTRRPALSRRTERRGIHSSPCSGAAPWKPDGANAPAARPPSRSKSSITTVSSSWVRVSQPSRASTAQLPARWNATPSASRARTTMRTLSTFIAPWRRSRTGPRRVATGEDCGDRATRRLRRRAGVPRRRWDLTNVRIEFKRAPAWPTGTARRSPRSCSNRRRRPQAGSWAGWWRRRRVRRPRRCGTRRPCGGR